MKGTTKLSTQERIVLDYITNAKKTKETVWLSEAVANLDLDPKAVVRSARHLEELGLLKRRPGW